MYCLWLLLSDSIRTNMAGYVDQWVSALACKGWCLFPFLILLVSDPHDILFCQGSSHQNIVKNMASHGYQVQEWIQDAAACGAAVDQQWWVMAFTWDGSPVVTPPTGLPLAPHPMRNLLMPPGIVPYHHWQGTPCSIGGVMPTWLTHQGHGVHTS